MAWGGLSQWLPRPGVHLGSTELQQMLERSRQSPSALTHCPHPCPGATPGCRVWFAGAGMKAGNSQHPTWSIPSAGWGDAECPQCGIWRCHQAGTGPCWSRGFQRWFFVRGAVVSSRENPRGRTTSSESQLIPRERWDPRGPSVSPPSGRHRRGRAGGSAGPLPRPCRCAGGSLGGLVNWLIN